MHEWALATAIITTVEEYAKKLGAEEVYEVNVVLGELQAINEEIMRYALENLKKGTICENAKFVFTTEKAKFKCRNCGHEWSLEEMKSKLSEDVKESIHFIPEVVKAFVKCPKCGSRDFEVLKGRGLYVSSIVVKENDRSKN